MCACTAASRSFPADEPVRVGLALWPLAAVVKEEGNARRRQTAREEAFRGVAVLAKEVAIEVLVGVANRRITAEEATEDIAVDHL